jgi:hypothetical protein
MIKKERIMADRIFPAFVVDLASIMPVINNQRPVPSELLFSYEGWPNQFDQLVEIVAEAQGVKPYAEGFRLFILRWDDGWAKWALLAKTFRKWLQSTHYSYKHNSHERLAELFLEHLVQQRICHDHSQDFRPGSRRDEQRGKNKSE